MSQVIGYSPTEQDVYNQYFGFVELTASRIKAIGEGAAREPVPEGIRCGILEFLGRARMSLEEKPVDQKGVLTGAYGVLFLRLLARFTDIEFSKGTIEEQVQAALNAVTGFEGLVNEMEGRTQIDRMERYQPFERFLDGFQKTYDPRA